MKKQITARIELEKAYHIFGPTDAEKMVLVLHGFHQTAEEFYERTKASFPDEMKVVLPDGLFLMPRQNKKTNELEEAYSWYHYSAKKDHYYTPMEPAISYVQQIFELEKSQTNFLLGYSQGAYMAPAAAEACGQIQKVICVNGGFRIERLPENPNFQITGIHGMDDNVVEYSGALERFQKWTQEHDGAEFISLKDTHHKWTPLVSETVKGQLK